MRIRRSGDRSGNRAAIWRLQHSAVSRPQAFPPAAPGLQTRAQVLADLRISVKVLISFLQLIWEYSDLEIARGSSCNLEITLNGIQTSGLSPRCAWFPDQSASP